MSGRERTEVFFLGEEYLVGFMFISCQIYVFNCFISCIMFLQQIFWPRKEKSLVYNVE